MEFSSKTGSPEKQRTACLIAGIYEGQKLTPAAEALDNAADGLIKALLKGGDLKGKPGQTLMLHRPQGLQCERLLLVGCGKPDELNDAKYRKIAQAALSAVQASAAKEALFCLAELPVDNRDLAWKVRQAVLACGQALYRFDQMKSEKGNDLPPLRKLTFLTASREESAEADEAAREGDAINAGMALTKDLANLPGNVCTPTYLADQAKALAREHKLKATVLEEKEMEKLGMGALISVSSGSRQPAKLIVVEYHGAKDRKEKPVVLVGKGLTFDAGGISIKPGAGMDEMKYDMCGGAAVLGVVKAAAALQLPINLVGVVPSSENLPDGNANKPGDIVTSMAGLTIEILNTDAEGRLILCDALTYSKKFNPEVVIDVATLTGACVIALGRQASGIFGNDQALVDALVQAGQGSGDRAWQLPLWEEYQDQLKSPFADMANVGGREAGSVTAACFLARFTTEYRWAHLDVAGTAWNSGSDKGATGRPVPLLMEYLLAKSKEER